MRKSKGCYYAVVILIIVFCLSGCGKTRSVTEIPLGDDLPVWLLDEEHTVAELHENAEEQGLVGIYTTDTDRADVYVYSFPREDGVSLEEFGQRQAAKYNVFCNMLTERNVPVAVLNYHITVEDEHYIVQAYIYQTVEKFVEVRTMFKTDSISLGSGDLSIHMIREYDAQEHNNSPLSFDKVYLTENDRLPMLRIRQFSKAEFPVDIIEPDLLNDISQEQYTAYAEDGWTLDEIIMLYDEKYDFRRGEVMCRNDLIFAFMGYTDDGFFKTRAVIDNGSDYIMLCAEAEASVFQHVTNALIDSIEKN